MAKGRFIPLTGNTKRERCLGNTTFIWVLLFPKTSTPSVWEQLISLVILSLKCGRREIFPPFQNWSSISKSSHTSKAPPSWDFENKSQRIFSRHTLIKQKQCKQYLFCCNENCETSCPRQEANTGWQSWSETEGMHCQGMQEPRRRNWMQMILGKEWGLKDTPSYPPVPGSPLPPLAQKTYVCMWRETMV